MWRNGRRDQRPTIEARRQVSKSLATDLEAMEAFDLTRSKRVSSMLYYTWLDTQCDIGCSTSSLGYDPEVFAMTEMQSLAQAHSTRRFVLVDAQDENEGKGRVTVSQLEIIVSPLSMISHDSMSAVIMADYKNCGYAIALGVSTRSVDRQWSSGSQGRPRDWHGAVCRRVDVE